MYLLTTYGWGSAAARILRGKLESCGFRVRRVLEEKSVSPKEGLGAADRVRIMAESLAREIIGR